MAPCRFVCDTIAVPDSPVRRRGAIALPPRRDRGALAAWSRWLYAATALRWNPLRVLPHGVASPPKPTVLALGA